jgi:hypothetical protein
MECLSAITGIRKQITSGLHRVRVTKGEARLEKRSKALTRQVMIKIAKSLGRP